MSTAACEFSFYSARTCKLSKNFSNGNTSCIGKTVSSVRCDHMVCRLYGNFKPYAASLLLQMKSKFSNEEKHSFHSQQRGKVYLWSPYKK